MKYLMKVNLIDPNTKKSMYNLELICDFYYDPEQYGNGHYVSIKGKEFYPLSYDLRYDSSFDRNNKPKWLEEWAKGYWTGKNGSWKIKSLSIEEVK